MCVQCFFLSHFSNEHFYIQSNSSRGEKKIFIFEEGEREKKMNYLILIEITIRSIEKDQEFCECFLSLNKFLLDGNLSSD